MGSLVESQAEDEQAEDDEGPGCAELVEEGVHGIGPFEREERGYEEPPPGRESGPRRLLDSSPRAFCGPIALTLPTRPPDPAEPTPRELHRTPGPAAQPSDRLATGAIQRRIAAAQEVVGIESRAVASLAASLGADFSRAVDLVLGCSGMVVVTGMGKAGLIGAKVSATLASTGTPSLVLHPAEALHGDLGRIRHKDLVLALSNSGETPEFKSLLPVAKRIGALTIAITRSRESTLGRYADCVLELGPLDEACPLGLAPTASTSAMLAMGDALAMVVLSDRGFSREDYALFHPAGALGRRLLRVDEIMRRGDQLPLARAGSTIREVLEVTNRTPGRPGAALIVDGDGRLVGIFTDGDLRRLLDRVETRPNDARVDDHMGKSPRVARPDQLVEEAMALLREHRKDQLPVVDGDGRPIGLVDVQDVLDLGV